MKRKDAFVYGKPKNSRVNDYDAMDFYYFCHAETINNGIMEHKNVKPVKLAVCLALSILWLHATVSCVSCGNDAKVRAIASCDNVNPRCSIDSLKGTFWETANPSNTIISRMYFTDTTVVTVRIFKDFDDSYIIEDRYYLSDDSRTVFDSSQVGKGTKGEYINMETGSSGMMVWKIAGISDSEMRLLLQPENDVTVGGRDTAVYRRIAGSPYDDTAVKSNTDVLSGTCWTASSSDGRIVTTKCFTDTTITTVVTYNDGNGTRTAKEEYYMSIHKPIRYEEHKVGTHTGGDYIVRRVTGDNVLASKIISISSTEMIVVSFPDKNQTIGYCKADTMRYKRQ